MNRAEKLIRSQSTENLKQLREDMLKMFKDVPEVVDNEYGLIKDELTKRGIKLT